MLSLLGIAAGIAAILAVVVTSLFIGACLAVARITDAVAAARGRQRGMRGGGGARAAKAPAAGSMHRGARRVPAAPRRGDQ
jgi:hypothetical protein